jgi:hypothetical protein
MAGDAPVNNIAEWTGTQWVALGSGLYGMPAWDLAIDSQDRLIAAGTFDTAGGVQVYGLARWDGQTWESISDGGERRISSLFFKGDTLYLASDRVWKLQDGIFVQVGEPFSHYLSDGSIIAMAFDNQGRLVVGGYFDKAGDVATNNIARWDGARWENLGSGTNNWVGSLVFNDSGKLFVGGAFSQAGGKVSMCFAQWNDPFFQWMPIIGK